ncbi:unnamed protein product [marine sediment metagenome]|uniref:Uncharacterized protein n=1 Tax=marine sediment metagenome TaxID=412755 RepID=X0V756_9ZZZZ
MNRRYFLMSLGCMAIVPFVPKVKHPKEYCDLYIDGKFVSRSELYVIEITYDFENLNQAVIYKTKDKLYCVDIPFKAGIRNIGRMK